MRSAWLNDFASVVHPIAARQNAGRSWSGDLGNEHRRNLTSEKALLSLHFGELCIQVPQLRGDASIVIEDEVLLLGCPLSDRFANFAEHIFGQAQTLISG